MERRIKYKKVVECFSFFHNIAKSNLGRTFPNGCLGLVDSVETNFRNKFYFMRSLKDKKIKDRKQQIALVCGKGNWVSEDETEISIDYVLRYTRSLDKILKFIVYYNDNGNIDYSSKAYLYNKENDTFDIAIPIAYLLDEESFLNYILSNYNAKVDRNILIINY